MTGNGSSPIYLESSNSGSPATITKASGSFYGDYVHIQDITATGGASYLPGNQSSNDGGNTGFTFLTDPTKIWYGTTNTDWNTATNWLDGVVPTTNDIVYLIDQTNDATITASTVATCKSLNIGTSATLTNNTTVVGGGSLSISGDLTNDGTLTSGATSTVIFNGNVSQAITGSSTSTFANLTINNSTGVTITTKPTITGTLTFTAGNITAASSSNPVILTSTSISGAGDGKCIVGYCQVNTSSTSKYTLPVGSTTTLKSIAVTPVGTGATTYLAKYFNTGYGNYTYSQVNGIIDHVISTEYWDLSRPSGSENCNIEIMYDRSSGGDENHTNYIIGHYTSGNWESTGDASVSGDEFTGTVATTTAVSSFSPFTRGSKTVSVPVPVTYLSFKANCKDNQTDLDWSTATELNNDNFTIENSTNGIDFKEIGTVKGAGTTNNITNYEFSDKSSVRNLTYYRLKQTDFDGKTSYSEIFSNNCFENKNISVFPNPNIGIFKLQVSSQIPNVPKIKTKRYIFT